MNTELEIEMLQDGKKDRHPEFNLKQVWSSWHKALPACKYQDISID